MAVTETSETMSERYEWSLEKMSRYPFLKESREYIKNEGPELMELITDRVWSMVRSRGKGRVMQALEYGNIRDKSISSELDMEIELYSYPVARILVSCIGDDYLVRRYALGEAERMLRNLNKETVEDVMKIGEDLGLDGSWNGDYVTLDFITYLENTEHLKASEWKLVNQDLRDGRVFLKEDKFKRILKENLHIKISKKLPRQVNDELIDIFSDQIDEINKLLEETRAEFETVDFGEVDSEKFPPCIKKLLALQNEGVNLSHEARFALTAFLHKIGLSEDEIISLFSESPDFRKDLALYQVEHITGEISGTEYTPPNCDTMKTNGICYEPDNLCNAEWMKHPLSYYSIKMKDKNKEKED